MASVIINITGVDESDPRLSDDRTASGLRDLTGVVSVSSAEAPLAGQTLTAVDENNATWQTPIDIDASLDGYLTLDGYRVMMGDLQLGGHNITGVGYITSPATDTNAGYSQSNSIVTGGIGNITGNSMLISAQDVLQNNPNFQNQGGDLTVRSGNAANNGTVQQCK